MERLSTCAGLSLRRPSRLTFAVKSFAKSRKHFDCGTSAEIHAASNAKNSAGLSSVFTTMVLDSCFMVLLPSVKNQAFGSAGATGLLVLANTLDSHLALVFYELPAFRFQLQRNS